MKKEANRQGADYKSAPAGMASFRLKKMSNHNKISNFAENYKIMTTIVLKVKDKKQLDALMDVVQRFKISFSGNMDETEYLLSTDENRESLEKSLKQSGEGKTRTIKTSELWK